MPRELSLDRLRDLLSYDPLTGLFVWRVSRGRAPAGSVAGSKNAVGYIAIRIDGRDYLGHRLAWFYVRGAWPADEIDHVNGDPIDNRIANLREASRSLNAQNMRRAARTNVSSGLLGVSLNKRTGKWTAKITVKGKVKHIGSFEDPQSAHEAYLAAKRQFHEGNTL